MGSDAGARMQTSKTICHREQEGKEEDVILPSIIDVNVSTVVGLRIHYGPTLFSVWIG